jgi:hypothetical protein
VSCSIVSLLKLSPMAFSLHHSSTRNYRILLWLCEGHLQIIIVPLISSGKVCFSAEAGPGYSSSDQRNDTPAATPCHQGAGRGQGDGSKHLLIFFKIPSSTRSMLHVLYILPVLPSSLLEHAVLGADPSEIHSPTVISLVEEGCSNPVSDLMHPVLQRKKLVVAVLGRRRETFRVC